MTQSSLLGGGGRGLCHQLNALAPFEATQRRALLSGLFGSETDASIDPLFFCDYGYNIKLGASAYFIVNCVGLDDASVVVGKSALFGPSVNITTGSHPMSAVDRRLSLELGTYEKRTIGW